MYGQSNYVQGSRTPMPPSQQPPPVPPPPPFQEGALASQPSMQGRPSIPPHVGQPGPPAYQHVPPAPVHQGPPVQVMPSGMLSAGQSYLSSTPPPPAPLQVHGSTSMTNSYPIARQNSLWHQNVRHVSPPVLPPLGQRPTGPNRPEVFRPPPPARVLGSLPSPGQTLCRAPVHPAQPGSVQVLQHIPPPPPRPPLPPTSSLFTPAPYGSFLHSAHQDSHMAAVVPPQPPPLPSSPPPLPPTPPPPSSPPPGSLCSIPVLNAAELPHHPESCPSSSAHFGFEVTTSGSVDEVSVPGHIRDDTAAHNDCINPEGGSSSEVGSITKDELDPSSPPPKPAGEKIIRKIEVLCQFIANNGPGFEEMVRLKESGNPEFIFLFGGESGSEAAVAHEYFLWMKKKYSLNSKFFRGHEKVDSPSRASDIDSSKQPNSSMDLCVSHSPSDSDMDMEDDITRTDEEQQHNNSVEGLNSDSALMLSKPDLKDQLHSAPTLQNASENSQCMDAASEHIRHCGSSRVAEEGKVSTIVADHDCSTFDQSFSKADGPVTTLAGAVEYTSNSNVERYSNFFHENLGQTNASVVVGCSSEKFPNELNKGASPFRLLQDYASDNSSENDDEPYIQDSGPVAGSPSSPAGGRSLHGNMASNFRTDMGSKSLSISETGTRTSFDLDVACPLSMPSKALELSRESQGTSKGTDMTSIVIRKVEVPVEMNYGNKECIKNAASQEVSPQKDALEGSIDAAPRSGKSEKEDAKYASTPLKVDEFGRLVREGASDSDSDDSRYTGKRVKRGRSWSRSRSPYDRRRRRRSPRRKKERSRSRSWSPKKRRSRSRSRSPTLRRVGEFGGNKIRRDKVHLPDCFDFLRGRCYRGASCRYLHNDPVKNDGSRHHRNKHQHVEFPPSSRSTDFHKEIECIPLKRSVHEPDEVKSKEMQLHHDMPVRSFSGSEDYIDGGKEIVSIQPIISDQGSKSLVTDMAESERSRAQVMDTQAVKDEFVEPLSHTPDHENCPDRLKTLQPVDRIPACLVTYGRVPKSAGANSHAVTSSTENTAITHSQGNLSLMLHNADHQPQKMDEPSGSNSSPIQTSTSYPNLLPISETYPDKIPLIQSYPETSSMSRPILCEGFPSQSKPSELTPPTFPSIAFPHHSSQFLRSIPSLSQGTKTSLAPHMPGDYNLMPPTAKFPSHSAPVENYPSHQAPLPSQHPHFSMPPNSSWTTLPPPPRPQYVIDSTANATTGMPGVPSLRQHNQLPPMNDFSSHTPVRPYSSELTTYTQSGEFPRQTHQPPFHMEDFKPKSIPTGNEANQPFGGPGPGEDRFTQSVHGLIPSSSFAHGSIPTQLVSFNSEEASRRIRSFPRENLHPGELATSSQNHPYLQQQQPLYDLQRSMADTASVRPSDSGSTMSRYTSDPLDQNHTPHVSDFSGSRISNHYNPYASTFDQPLSSKFSSSVLGQINSIPYGNKHDASFIFSHAPGDYQGVGSLGSRHMTSSPTSARAVEHILPRLGGDKYDPLFDSIELSSDPIKKFDCDQKHELAKNSDITSRLSDSCKPLDLEENSKRKHVEAVAVITSLECENDEYGETADAEVGAVENGSPSNSLDVVDAAAGEIEIDQVKMPGKSKKSKDSKSMKLFKIALADFVKEVLKPSWRQGNMSKEAFKTIVKKTVDKVSGAMKSHQIPKSQAKINHYIDSSQRKLTKLVMGYVDKYVKV